MRKSVQMGAIGNVLRVVALASAAISAGACSTATTRAESTAATLVADARPAADLVRSVMLPEPSTSLCGFGDGPMLEESLRIIWSAATDVIVIEASDVAMVDERPAWASEGTIALNVAPSQPTGHAPVTIAISQADELGTLRTLLDKGPTIIATAPWFNAPGTMAAPDGTVSPLIFAPLHDDLVSSAPIIPCTFEPEADDPYWTALAALVSDKDDVFAAYQALFDPTNMVVKRQLDQFVSDAEERMRPKSWDELDPIRRVIDPSTTPPEVMSQAMWVNVYVATPPSWQGVNGGGVLCGRTVGVAMNGCVAISKPGINGQFTAPLFPHSTLELFDGNGIGSIVDGATPLAVIQLGPKRDGHENFLLVAVGAETLAEAQAGGLVDVAYGPTEAELVAFIKAHNIPAP
jgi:hypothetical protein